MIPFSLTFEPGVSLYEQVVYAAKKAVISGLGNQNNAEAMIAIYRKESNFEIKKQIVSSLGNMPKNEAAKTFLLEILK